MKEEVVRVIGPIDSLQVANEVLVNVVSERFGGLDLVIGGCVEVKDLRVIGEFNRSREMVDNTGYK